VLLCFILLFCGVDAMSSLQVRGRVVYFGLATGNSCINYLKGITTTSNSHSQSHPHPHQQPQRQPPKDPSSNGSMTAPAVLLLNQVQSQQLADGSVVGLNPAEWLVDLFTQADRDGRGGDFADAYDASQLKQVCRICAAQHGVTLCHTSLGLWPVQGMLCTKLQVATTVVQECRVQLQAYFQVEAGWQSRGLHRPADRADQPHWWY
jgi:hypothetical protein